MISFGLGFYKEIANKMRIIPLLLLFVLAPVFAASPEATYGTHGMVTSRSVYASRAGIEIMKQGGNAVDAAVATAFALAVTYPDAGNLGGGGFAVIRLKDGKVVTLDNREKAPEAATTNMYLDKNGKVIKGLSLNTLKASGVPGSVDGYIRMLDKYGTLPLKKVIAPAIKLARDGFPLSHDMALQFAAVLPKMKDHPASIQKFSHDGVPYKDGEIFRQPDLAQTLMRIADNGRDGFYKGMTAKMIVAEMERGGGLITMKDLADYKSVWRDPIHGTYRGYDIWGMAPPSSGGILVVQILNMLEPYNLRQLGWHSAQAIHLIVEAERRAYADRAKYLGDPAFFKVPVSHLISKAYAKKRMADVKTREATPSSQVGAGKWPHSEDMETTHFSVTDKDGMMVSFTTTLNSGFGNKIVVPGTGMLLNNEMNDFSIKPNTPNQFGLLGAEANKVEPGKRMLSSMSPTIVTKDGKPFLAVGSPGGSTIITTTLQVIINVIDYHMDIADAVSLPRFHHQWKPDVVMYEPWGISPDTLRILKSHGYHMRLARWGRGIGDANCIEYRDGAMYGIKDPRNEGGAVGY